MLKLAWDFALSLTIRAIFVFALVGGVCLLIWTRQSWSAGEWKDDPNQALISVILSAAVTVVGLLGTMRSGNTESNFSVAAAASAVGGAAIGGTSGLSRITEKRTLRRFPALENMILGGCLIAIWGTSAVLNRELWPLRIGAITGAALLVWAALLRKRGAGSLSG